MPLRSGLAQGARSTDKISFRKRVEKASRLSQLNSSYSWPCFLAHPTGCREYEALFVAKAHIVRMENWNEMSKGVIHLRRNIRCYGYLPGRAMQKTR